LLQHDVCAAAVHLADIVAFKRVYEAIGHAVGQGTKHRRIDWLNTQLFDRRCLSLARKAPPLSIKNSNSMPLRTLPGQSALRRPRPACREPVHLEGHETRRATS
jgi:hypothetical protein